MAHGCHGSRCSNTVSCLLIDETSGNQCRGVILVHRTHTGDKRFRLVMAHGCHGPQCTITVSYLFYDEMYGNELVNAHIQETFQIGDCSLVLRTTMCHYCKLLVWWPNVLNPNLSYTLLQTKGLRHRKVTIQVGKMPTGNKVRYGWTLFIWHER